MSVAYIYSKRLEQLSDAFTRCHGRASRIHELITAYGLLDATSTDTRIVSPRAAQPEDLKYFHDSDFVDFLLNCNERSRDDVEFAKECELYGLEFECPVLDELGEYVLLLAGAAQDAAECLKSGIAKIAINWFGGWHHCRKDYAAGFCYINDCVLSILHLLKKFERVLYIDLDVHHGDGVQEAFYCTNKVFSLSFHRYSPGLFYPGTGDLSEIGSYKGFNYSLNVPFHEGLKNEPFMRVSSTIVEQVVAAFQPDAIVCQCGADSLAHDPVQGLNLTSIAYVDVVRKIRKLDLPLLVLGGGGYHRSNTARCWSSIQAELVNKWPLVEDIPEHEYLDEYGPCYSLEIKESKMKDLNSEQHLNEIVEKCGKILSKIAKPGC